MFKQIISNSDGLVASVNSDSGEDTGLVVATRDHKSYTTKTVFFTNPAYGREMAQDGKFGGAPLVIHNGTDDVAWTFSEPVGIKWEADSTDRYYAGAKALKCNNPNINDVMQVINNVGPGNNIDMTGNYVALTMWINVDVDWAAGDSFSLYAHVDGALVGNSVNLEDYFPYAVFDQWHYINIPLTDLGIESSSIDAFRIENTAREGAKSPVFYIDKWQLEESGAAIDFSIEPDKGTWFHIKSFQTTFVDAYNADNADSTMPHLSYNKFLGLTTTAGYIYKRFSEGNSDPISQARITNLMDLLNFPYTTINNYISDGTNTLITIENTYPPDMRFTLKAEDLDKITYAVEDKFDDLLFFRICCQGYVEQRT